FGGSAEISAKVIEITAASQKSLITKLETAGFKPTASEAVAYAKWVKAGNIAKGAGLALSAVGAVVDGIGAYQDFKAGRTMEGVGNGLSAIGGTVLAVEGLAVLAGAQAVPVVGQIAAGLVIIGTAIKMWGESRRERKKEQA